MTKINNVNNRDRKISKRSSLKIKKSSNTANKLKEKKKDLEWDARRKEKEASLAYDE